MRRNFGAVNITLEVMFEPCSSTNLLYNGDVTGSTFGCWDIADSYRCAILNVVNSVQAGLDHVVNIQGLPSVVE